MPKTKKPRTLSWNLKYRIIRYLQSSHPVFKEPTPNQVAMRAMDLIEDLIIAEYPLFEITNRLEKWSNFKNDYEQSQTTARNLQESRKQGLGTSTNS
jgi:hypothetical protein